MTRARQVQIVALLIMALCLSGAGFLANRMSAISGRAHLTYADRAEDGQPPEVALGIAMGAFRGIFVNYLWFRANELKEAGKYYEAVELSRIITRLQPRFPRVWVFHAWNLSYNISVSTQTREERWQWVQDGVRLLREQGIRANPNDLLLHKELAWIFLHKIQGITDDANIFYKWKMAEEWTNILGVPPTPDPKARDHDSVSKQFAAWLQPIADAPETLEQLYEADPSTRGLLAVLKADTAVTPSFQLLRMTALKNALDTSGRRAAMIKTFDPRSLRFLAISEDPAFAGAWKLVLAHTRKRVLVDEYNMEPSRMVRYTLKYGPIDWRSPAAHGLYWAARGVDVSLGRVTQANQRDFDFTNTDRIVIQSIQELYRSGSIYFDYLTFTQGQRPVWFAVPNDYFVETYIGVLSELRARSKVDDLGKRVFTLYSAGFENFIKDAIRVYFRRGDKATAQKYYTMLGTWEGMNVNDPDRARLLSLPLEEFVYAELTDRQDSGYVAVQEVVGALQGAYLNGLLGDDTDLFRELFKYAADFHNFYFKKQFRSTNIDPTAGRMEQMDSDFRNVAGGIFYQFLTQLPLGDAERVYNRAPEDLRLYAYDMLVERFKAMKDEEEKRGGTRFEVSFPAPPGLEAHRKRMDELRQKLEQRQAPRELK